MKKHSGVLLVILLVIIIIGGCALKDRLLKKETPKQITNSLQLFLKFDASSIEDLSDYHNLISKQGSFNFTEDYNRFDGKTTFIEIGKDFNKNQALSIGFWIKPVKRQSGFILANGPVQNTPSLLVFFDSFKRVKLNRGKSSEYSSQDSVPFNKWTHVFITSDGSNAVFYINGIKQNEFIQETIVNANHTKTYIGKGFECSTIAGSFRCSDTYFDGYLDDLRVYNQVLSSDEIQKIYEETKK
ncbi:LamG domain-containing protein [Candidatus Woesearchaeota archaeon]|nr:LamG domain-containing protein [Candidatus Woesearchaeota archaeon]